MSGLISSFLEVIYIFSKFLEIKYTGQIKEKKLDVLTAIQQSSLAVDGDSKSGVFYIGCHAYTNYGFLSPSKLLTIDFIVFIVFLVVDFDILCNNGW